MKKLSVSDLNAIVRSTIKDNLKQLITVEGEISNPKISGKHTYCTIKDSNASINVAFWGQNISKDIASPGDNVEIEGHVDFYAKTGNLNLIGKTIQKVGLGSVHSKYIEIKESFEKKGYFDIDKKKALPSNIKSIGVITAGNGAALQDFIRVLQNNQFKGELYVYNAIVQGAKCPSSVCEGLRFFDSAFNLSVDVDIDTDESNSNSDPDSIDSIDPFNPNPKTKKINITPEIDIIVMTRGGGSFEDLMGFSDPKVLEAVHRSSKYTISSVGHEVDSMLSDFVADASTGTPSMAGDMVSKAHMVRYSKLVNIEKKLNKSKVSILRCLNNIRQNIVQLNHAIQDPIFEIKSRINHIMTRSYDKIQSSIKKYTKFVDSINKRISIHDSTKLLQNGFSVIVNSNNQIIRDCDLFGTELRLIHGSGTYRIKIENIE